MACAFEFEKRRFLKFFPLLIYVKNDTWGGAIFYSRAIIWTILVEV